MTEKAESPEGEKLTPRHKIHTEPLTQILDEIDDSIRLANEAARDARDAAEEARRAGEKAAGEAARVTAGAIAKINEAVQRALQLAELVKQAGTDAANAYQKRISGKHSR